MKVHKEVTGVDADYWGSAVYYSMLQMIEQAIEGVGSLDLKAITDHIKSRTFKTHRRRHRHAQPEDEEALDRRSVAERHLPRRCR